MTPRPAPAGAAALLALAGLAGCATVPRPPPSAAPAPAARDALAAFDAWHASGRVAVRTAQDGWNASFDWREAPDHGELAVRGPFGAGAARVVRTPQLIRIESGSAAPLEVPAPFDALEPALAARLGVPLPLEALRFWVLGVPAPGAPSEAVDAGAGPDVTAFRQSGWTVRVEGFVAVAGAPAPLPHKVAVERDATRIRVVVDRWETP